MTLLLLRFYVFVARDWFINECDKYTNDSATLLRLSHTFFWRSHLIKRRSQLNCGDSSHKKNDCDIFIGRSQIFYGGVILSWGGVTEILVTQHIKKMTPHILHMTQTQLFMTPPEISTTPYIFPWLRHNRNFWLRQKRVTFCKSVIKWAWSIFIAPESFYLRRSHFFFMTPPLYKMTPSQTLMTQPSFFWLVRFL
jgi:hypothetical protein